MPGTTAGQFDRGSVYAMGAHSILFTVPDAGNGPIQFYNQTDLTGLTAGDVLCSKKAHGWPWTVAITVSDNASSDLSVGLTIIGIDHFGNEVTETLTGLGDGIHITANIYKLVISVTLDSISNAAALDVLQIGVRGSAGADPDASDSGSFALPLNVETGDVLGVLMSNIDQVNTTGNITIDYDAKRADITTDFNTASVYGVIMLDPRKDWAW